MRIPLSTSCHRGLAWKLLMALWRRVARERLRGRDEDDWSYLAPALGFAYPFWTEDWDFFGYRRSPAATAMSSPSDLSSLSATGTLTPSNREGHARHVHRCHTAIPVCAAADDSGPGTGTHDHTYSCLLSKPLLQHRLTIPPGIFPQPWHCVNPCGHQKLHPLILLASVAVTRAPVALETTPLHVALVTLGNW